MCSSSTKSGLGCPPQPAGWTRRVCPASCTAPGAAIRPGAHQPAARALDLPVELVSDAPLTDTEGEGGGEVEISGCFSG